MLTFHVHRQTLTLEWLLPIHIAISIPILILILIYRSYILSNFNYCPLVWHFCGIQNSRNMEKIQERALRFVYEDYESTYDILLKKGNHDVIHRSLKKYDHWNI